MPSFKQITLRLDDMKDRLYDIVESMRPILIDLETLCTDQREAYENMPESLQTSERGEISAQRADELDELADWLREMIEALDEVEMTVE